MKNLLLILVILIMGITNAQDTPCNPLIQEDCPPTQVDWDSVDFSSMTPEDTLNEIVDIFFQDLEWYNYYYGSTEFKEKNWWLFPFDGIYQEEL